jgi:hypothetical protein
VQRAALIAVLLLVPACAPRRDAEIPDLPRSPERRVRGDEIVAFLDGLPLTWQAVADRVMELDLKSAVDQYVRWKIVEERREAMKLVHTPEELRKRAELYAEQQKRSLGAAEWAAHLARQGVPEAAYVGRLADSGFLSQVLTFDKILRYDELLEDRLELRISFFPTRETAEEALRGSPDPGARSWTFPRSRPPLELPFRPEVVAKLMNLPEKDRIGVEPTAPEGYSVYRMRVLRPGRTVSYEEARREVWDDIVARPPAPEEYPRWMERARMSRRVEYAGSLPRREGDR